MGNSQTKGQIKSRQKKQVHWKAAERPGPPGKPYLVSETEIRPDVVTIRWDKPKYDGGSPITGYLVEHRRTGSPHWVRATPILVTVSELTLSGLEPGWRYQFRITAQNAVGMSDPGEISEPLTVTLQRSVITAPKFTEELHETTALENEMAEFVVHVIGQPPPKICWFKDGFEIFSSRRTRILTENDRSVLTIYQVSLSDEGEIKCTATNKAGHASTKCTVKVEAPPVIRLPRNYEDGLLFELDEVIRLKVSIAGRPQPLIFWSHNGETIQTNERYEITETDKSSVLKIGEAKRTDRGEYQIRAVNKLGEDSTSFLVTVTDKPQPPKSLKVIMSLGKTVTLSWETPEDDGGCRIGNYILEYYRIGWNVWLKAATCRNLSTTLSDLIEGSEYKFRVKAESPYGVSDPSDETDVIFIPDPKRGLLSPPPRSKSLTREHQRETKRETSPVPPKRRSTSSTRASNREQVSTLIPPNAIPTAPKREKIRSPQKSPDNSPLAQRKYMTGDKNIFDRSSLARELSYGSPDHKYKKPEVKPSSVPPKEVPKTPPAQFLQPIAGSTDKTEEEAPIIQRARSPSLINQLLSRSNEHSDSKNKTPSPVIQRERSPSIINQLLSNILPQKKTPTPSPKSSPPKENNSPVPSPEMERKEEEILIRINSLKGDRLDRLSPNISTRRLSSPMVLDQRDKSPSPIDKRNRSPSLVESLLNQSPNSLSPSSSFRSKSPSPSPPANKKFTIDNSPVDRSPSPSRCTFGNNEDFRRGSIKSYEHNNDMVHDSSEFMLVLVDDQDGNNQDYFMFEHNLIAPPMSLSAPELGIDSNLFAPLKTSVSSTELLHERAFARFVKDAEESNRSPEIISSRRNSLEIKSRIIELDERRPSIPKILINSKDNEEIVGLERKSLLGRRLSAGAATMAQQYVWAKRRHSLRNSAFDQADLGDMKQRFSEKMRDLNNQGRSIFEEKEEIQEIYSEEESESEDERSKADLIPPNITAKEEETYHPRMMISTNQSKFEEPFEILTKPTSPPDPSFVPKPILKRKEEKERMLRKKERSVSPSFIQSNQFIRSRTPSPSPEPDRKSPSPIPSPIPGRKLAEAQLISAAEAAKNKRMLRQSSEEERIVADYYMDLVKEFGYQKQTPRNTYIHHDDVTTEEKELCLPILSKKREISPVRTITPVPPTIEELQTRRETSRSATRTRNTSNSRTSRRNPSPAPKINASSATIRRPLPDEPLSLPKPQEQDHKLILHKPKTRSRSTSRTRTAKRDSSGSRTVTPTTLQNRLLEISRTPSPRPTTPEQEAIQAEVEIKVRTTMEYLTDLAMFIVAFWLYLFKDARLAIPILIIMVYRQLKDEIANLIPTWMLRKKQ